MIRIRNLDFRYSEGEFRLQIPELHIAPRQSAAVIGPSGCGKTTLLRLVAGIMLPQAGQIVTQGRSLNSLADGPRRDFRIRTIGLVFQEFELLEYLTVLDNILLPYRINRSLVLDQAARGRAEKLAREVGLQDKLRRYPDQLSQGEKQRVAVCRALVTEPVLLMADEPTGNLDPTNKWMILDILQQFVRESGATLLTVTHDHELLSRFEQVIDFQDLYAAAPPGGAS